MSSRPSLAALALGCGMLWAALAFVGDLRGRASLYLLLHGALVLMMLWAWRECRAGRGQESVVLLAALAFRLLACLSPPTLSDDLYRYLWDGRVQVAGFHPYAHAPDDPALEPLRDAEWARINHREIPTIYPPLAQLAFRALAHVGGGQLVWKLGMALADFAVVLMVRHLLRRSGLPAHRLVLYAWNPLAIVETAGSGHLEPLGVALMLVAVSGIIGCRPGLSTSALAAAVQVKLLPLVLVPGALRRAGWRGGVVFIVVTAGLLLPFVWSGPAWGGGLFAYAERWEYNGFVYAGIEGLFEQLDTGRSLAAVVTWLRERIESGFIPWDWLYGAVWPRPLARAVVVGVLLLAVLASWWREGTVLGQAERVLGTAIVLLPVVHPWYALWVLPLAVVSASPGWIAFSCLVPLAYLAPGDVPWALRCAIWLPPLALWLRTRPWQS